MLDIAFIVRDARNIIPIFFCCDHTLKTLYLDEIYICQSELRAAYKMK